MGTTHQCYLMRKLISKEVTAGGKFDFSGLCTIALSTP